MDLRRQIRGLSSTWMRVTGSWVCVMERFAVGGKARIRATHAMPFDTRKYVRFA